MPDEHLERLDVIDRRWRTEHRWLTDANDLPAAALHASRDVPIDVLAADIERAYTRLYDAGFTGGQELQLVSQLLAVDPRGTDAGVDRFTLAASIELSADTEQAGERSAGDLAALQSIQRDPGCPAGGDDRGHLGRGRRGRVGRSPLSPSPASGPAGWHCPVIARACAPR